MCSRISFEEEKNKEAEVWIKICKYLLWGIMIGVAALLASRALHAEGKEMVVRTEESNPAQGEYGTVVREALLSQAKLMEYAGIGKKEQRLYHMQMHRLAFFKDIKGGDTGLYWCNELSELTMEAYEKLDSEGKKLLTDCQISREQWKEAGDKKSQGNEQEIRELINQFYYMQLQCIMNQECA